MACGLVARGGSTTRRNLQNKNVRQELLESISGKALARLRSSPRANLFGHAPYRRPLWLNMKASGSTLPSSIPTCCHEAPPYKVFVSYKHSESSAFALLVVTRLKEHGLYAFCDMRLVPGDPWHAELENRVRDSKFQVLLLGPTTLCSKYVVQEIEWALDSCSKIVPISHNKFDFVRKSWERVLSKKVLDAIDHNQRIPIPREHESAAGYDIAIRTLLTNRFGITP